VAAGRGVGPAVRRLADGRPGRWGAAAVHRLDHRAGTPARGRGEKKDRQADDALGRSRGGYTTKIHLACTDEDTAVAVTLTAGQAGDAPQFNRLFAAAHARVPDADEVVTDLGYDSHAIRATVLAAGLAPQVPSKRTAVEPWPVWDESYRERNRVERLFAKLKQFRAVATRYDKLGDSFLATIQTALCFINLRAFVNSA
jgi:transposase